MNKTKHHEALTKAIEAVEELETWTDRLFNLTPKTGAPADIEEVCAHIDIVLLQSVEAWAAVIRCEFEERNYVPDIEVSYGPTASTQDMQIVASASCLIDGAAQVSHKLTEAMMDYCSEDGKADDLMKACMEANAMMLDAFKSANLVIEDGEAVFDYTEQDEEDN